MFIYNAIYLQEAIIQVLCWEKFFEMQQSWLLHIHFYTQGSQGSDVKGLDAEDKLIMADAWSDVVQEAADSGISVDLNEQRIIVSSLAYIVFDLMSTELKNKKVFRQGNGVTDLESSAMGNTHAVLNEMIYRYAGMALMTVIVNR